MPWKELIFHNFGWKLLSCLLAIQIWFNIHSGIEENVTLKRNLASTGGRGIVSEIAVQILAPPGSAAAAFRLSPSTVNITLSGDYDVLKKLEAREVQAFIRITGSADETNKFTRQVKVLPPVGLSVDEVSPQMLSVERMPEPVRENLRNPK